ncbi:MAG: hypothetical protein RIQ81_1129 [Pseudomonadota bacterium]|jgi:hypothetical protein
MIQIRPVNFRLRSFGGMALPLITLFILSGCRTLKPYEKEHLLKPAMDDARLQSLEPVYARSTAAQFEKLAAGAAAGGGGSSCPTCGI